MNIVDYLASGELMKILTQDYDGRRVDPWVWIMQEGDTWRSYRQKEKPGEGAVGGEYAPEGAIFLTKAYPRVEGHTTNAVQGQKGIFRAKEEEVLDYLEHSLKLNKQEAEEVVRRIGVLP